MSETFVYANVMDKGSYAERVAMRQAAQEQEKRLAERQYQQAFQRIEPPLTPSVAEPTTLQPKNEPEPTQLVSRKLTDRKQLIRTMLDQLIDPPEQQQRLRQRGPRL